MSSKGKQASQLRFSGRRCAARALIWATCECWKTCPATQRMVEGRLRRLKGASTGFRDWLGSVRWRLLLPATSPVCIVLHHEGYILCFSPPLVFAPLSGRLFTLPQLGSVAQLLIEALCLHQGHQQIGQTPQAADSVLRLEIPQFGSAHQHRT